jgi:hypothetical protein
MNINERISQLKRELYALEQSRAIAYEDLKTQFQTANKKEREALAMQLPQLTPYHIDLLQTAGFRTGSSVYSNATPADVDWVINAPSTAFGTHALSCGDGWQYDEMDVLYAHYNGELYNIICVDNRAYDIWQETTELMKHLHQTEPALMRRMDIKWARVRLYRAIKDVLEPPVSGKKTSYYKDAIQFRKCGNCGREAHNFISKEYEDQYKLDGICDRCRTELNMGTQI